MARASEYTLHTFLCMQLGLLFDLQDSINVDEGKKQKQIRTQGNRLNELHRIDLLLVSFDLLFVCICFQPIEHSKLNGVTYNHNKYHNGNENENDDNDAKLHSSIAASSKD